MFAEPWIGLWTIPNPFVQAVYAPLRPFGVSLNDFSFNRDAATIAETWLNVEIKSLKAAIRIGLDRVTFMAANPSWNAAPQLVSAFEAVSVAIRKLTDIDAESQTSVLGFHLTAGQGDFRARTGELVNAAALGDGLFYGVSVHRDDSSLAIERSLSFNNAAFIRLERRLGPRATFPEIATALYADEMAALSLLGIPAIP